MKKQPTIKTVFTTLALINAFAAMQLPAMAVVSDPMTIYRLQARRNDLLQKESRLLRDKDDLNRQLDDLRRRGEPQYLLNDVCQRLDAKHNDLQKTRMDLRDVDRYLL